MNGFTKRIIACTALVLVAGALAAPVPAFAQIVESDLRRMSVEQLRDQLQQFQSGKHELSTQDARREMRKIQRELQRRSANREQIQQQQPPQVQQPQPQQPQKQAGESNVNREARQYLRSNGNVAQLNDRQLVDAIRTGRSLLQQPDLRGNLQNQVRQTVQAAVAERERRQNAVQQPQQPPAGGNADAAARRLLSDNRPASALRDNQLRDRLQEARRVMGDSSLDRRLFRQVRRLAAGDADELRNRVSQRQEDRSERREDRQDARQLLNDQRPAARLNDVQLQARITSARDLLASNTLRPAQQARIQDMLNEARREKRQRLIAERQRRRDDLARQRPQNQIIIKIPRGVFEYRDDIAAAEADDELLERQLIAPPTRRIDRRYSRSELQRARGWRDSMPAIEVDTIRFGFNESFVREEEIPQLERIGEIIERIVASNPDEVFLIEGHTDAVGSDSYNLSLSEKRADAVRNAMLQYFNIAPENIETIGYGEDFLKIETEEAEQENRRVTIRRITPLLTGAR
ncbi:MAG: OmpA family protein [Anderseniella sp.]|jgi:outer membrane protein OmpA-like peptidoglycan-associated protein|nr:OmpA family protein [Anderseniella sp.]